MNRERLINTLLVLGVFIGISLALFSSIRDTNFDDNRDWAARVGGTEISREKYLLQLDGLNSDKRAPLNKEDKAFVLEQMKCTILFSSAAPRSAYAKSEYVRLRLST